mgnify:FL=1
MSQNYFYAVMSGNVLHITLFMEANKNDANKSGS